MKKLYCISGLGADHRAFQNLSINDVEICHLPWIDPEENETLPEYANRLGEGIAPEGGFYLAGLSFGGMLAQEIAKHLPPEKLFLISTMETSDELPGHLKLAGKLNLNQLVPLELMNRPNAVLHRLFGVTTAEEKELLDSFIRDADPRFIKWALGAILNWENQETTPSTRFHGSADRILPIDLRPVGYVVDNGGHLMILQHGKAISEIINQVIEES